MIKPQESLVRAGGLQLHLSRWHVGTRGRPLLFLNGLCADASAAAPLLRRMSGREVWTIDMPGTGGSPDCFWPYSVQSIAGAVMNVVSGLTDGPIDCAGFSWGGALAQQITALFPDQINRLALLATGSNMSVADLGWGAVTDRDIQRNSLRMPVCSPLGLTYQSLAMAGWSNDSLVSRLAGHSILVISGSDDQIITKAHGQKLADQLGHAQHHIVIGGHLFPFAKAAETSAVIESFLDQPDQPAASKAHAAAAPA